MAQASAYAGLNKEQLKDALRRLGQPVGGNKPELLNRLEQAGAPAQTYGTMTNEALRGLLRARQQPIGGKKAELLQRLGVAAPAAAGGAFAGMTNKQLKDELKKRGQQVGGTKAELLERLQAAGRAPSPRAVSPRAAAAAAALPHVPHMGGALPPVAGGFEQMTKEQLKEALKAKGAKGYSTLNKPELIAMLQRL